LYFAAKLPKKNHLCNAEMAKIGYLTMREGFTAKIG